jgi:hypothetical protein
LVIVAVFAVPAIALFPVVHLSTGFTATVHAKTVQFQTASWTDRTAGLFNDGKNAIDLTVEDFDRFESAEGSSPINVPNTGEAITLHGVRLDSLDVTKPLSVSLEAGDRALSIVIERKGQEENKGKFGTFLADDDSKLPASMTGPKSKYAREWLIFGRHNRLHLTLRGIKNPIGPEKKVPLSDGSSVTFEDANSQSTITSAGEVQLYEIDRKLPVADQQSLVLGNLKGAYLRLEPEAESIKVTVFGGSSGRILRDGTNEAATLAEYFTSQKPLAAYLSTVALIGTFLLTVLTRFKLIQHFPKN